MCVRKCITLYSLFNASLLCSALPAAANYRGSLIGCVYLRSAWSVFRASRPRLSSRPHSGTSITQVASGPAWWRAPIVTKDNNVEPSHHPRRTFAYSPENPCHSVRFILTVASCPFFHLILPHLVVVPISSSSPSHPRRPSPSPSRPPHLTVLILPPPPPFPHLTLQFSSSSPPHTPPLTLLIVSSSSHFILIPSAPCHPSHHHSHLHLWAFISICDRFNEAPNSPAIVNPVAREHACNPEL